MQKEEAIRRYETLMECLTMIEAQVRRFSKNQTMMTPKPGYERAWNEENEKRAVIQQMIREIREAGWD